MLGKKLIKAAAGNAGGANPYIEDVFSTYLYTGTGSAQPITNGIALGDSNVGGSVYFGDTAGYPLMFDSAISLTSDCTVEFFIYRRVSGGSGECIFSPDYGGTGLNRQMGIIYNTGYLFVYDGTTKVGSGASVPLGAWRHVAFSKSGSTVYFWVNGVSGGSITSSLFSIVGMGNLMGYTLPAGPDAWISNLRISNTARYTSAFTAPTSALTSDANTILLALQGDDPFVDQTSNYTLTPYTVSAAKFGPFTGSGVGEGGLVWVKQRSDVQTHNLYDTERGTTRYLLTTSTLPQQTVPNSLTAFNSDGFSFGSDSIINQLSRTYTSWTFRKAPKFFDCVTYTGTGVARTIAHNLGSVPGCIIVKAYDGFSDWYVYHRANTANPETDYLLLNSTAATADLNTIWNDTAPTDSVFSVGTGATNSSGTTYVAYLFAHDAGGFGDDGLQNVISCGSFVANSGWSVDLGWEPQWFLVKATSQTSNWVLVDNMRGWPVGSNSSRLLPNTSDAEAVTFNHGDITPTGFQAPSGGSNPYGSGQTYIYIAIRRGPMKTPTSGTEVFAVDNGNSSDIPAFNSGFPVDMGMTRSTSISTMYLSARLTQGRALVPQSTAAETTLAKSQFDYMSGWINQAEGSTDYGWMFRRAPGFFDVVAYTGNGASGRNLNHNLGVAPEMMIVKSRSGTYNWTVYHKDLGLGYDYFISLNTQSPATGFNVWGSNPTDSVFTVQSWDEVNRNTTTYVAYLFATLAGVSKVGSYTGTGTTLQIDCGFSAGARFVLIRRTDSSGDWYVWDSARGIVSGNDPFILINSTAAENTSTDYIDPLSSGFEISSTAPAAINASGGTFIFLAIA